MTSTSVPASLTAGDTVTWTKSIQDYAATNGYSLKYRFVNATTKIDITASASGADYAVSVAASTTAAWVAGDYEFMEWVEKGAERYTISTGRVSIKPNIANLTTFDGRSDARITLEALKSAFKTFSTGGGGHVAEYEIAGRRMKFRTTADFVEAINYWQAVVVSEDVAERIARGLGGAGKILTRLR